VKRRIEILVDADFVSNQHLEDCRLSLECLVGEWVKPRLPSGYMVQANEVPLEGQTWLHSPEVKS
jgi:hypothetical protein